MFDIKSRSSFMIGSMPQNNPDAALGVLEQFPLTIPTWPQLPKRSFKEGMIPQYSEGFPGIRVDEENKRIWLERDDSLIDRMTGFYEKVIADEKNFFSISAEYAAGLTLFLSGLENQNQKFEIIKGQVTGPFTFGLGLNDNDGKALWFDPQYKDIVLKGIGAKVKWLAGQLKKFADNVIILLDEPILSALGTPAYIGIQDQEVIDCLNEVIELLHGLGAAVGVHCCGNMDWGLLAKTAVDIISFDAYFFSDKLALYPREIGDFLERGGYLAWGIVPTSDHETLTKETAEGLRQAIDERIELFVKKGIPEQKIRNQMLLTPSCGIGTLSEQDSETVLSLLSNIK